MSKTEKKVTVKPVQEKEVPSFKSVWDKAHEEIYAAEGIKIISNLSESPEEINQVQESEKEVVIIEDMKTKDLVSLLDFLVITEHHKKGKRPSPLMSAIIELCKRSAK